MKEKILNLIETNSRLTAEDIAALLGYSEEDVKTAIMEMEADRVICGYHTLIDWDKAKEEKVIALIEVKVTPQRGMGFDKIAERIFHYPEVHACYLMSGAFDFTVILEEKTMREIANFVSGKLAVLESVQSTATHFVLKKYKDHGIVMDQPLPEERMKVWL